MAHSLVKECLAEARKKGLLVVSLHASDAGRPVYESMGFHPSNEMFHVDSDKLKAS